MKTSSITFGGILTAVSFILLYFIKLIPTNTLTLLTLLSFIPPIALMEKGLKTALLVYICSGIGSLFYVPLNISLFYVLFFGIYGIIKGFIERINKPFTEWLIKFIYFNIMSIMGLLLLRVVLAVDLQVILSNFLSLIEFWDLNSTFSKLLLYLLLQIAFFIFDYALTLLVGYYDDYIRKYMK